MSAPQSRFLMHRYRSFPNKKPASYAETGYHL